MKRFASLIVIPAIAALGFVAVPAATGTSPGIHNGQSVHLTAAEIPAAPQPCEAGYTVWINGLYGNYLLSFNIQGDRMEVSTSDYSCWHFPDSGGNAGEIRDEAGYCAEYNRGYVVSAACSNIPAQQWFINNSECDSGWYVAENEWALDHSQSSVFMSEDGSGFLINLAATCDDAASWQPA